MSRTIFSQASQGQKFQNISFLLAQGQHRGQNALNKKAALFALRAETAFTPQYAPPQRAFGRIIGRFDPLMVDKRPQGGFDFKDIGTGFARWRLIGQYPDCLQSFDFAPNGLNPKGEFRTAQGSIPHPMPMTKQQVVLLEEQFPNDLRLPTAFKQGLKIAFQMGPTHLTADRVKARVGRPAIRAQDPREPCSQQAFDPLRTAGSQEQESRHQACRVNPQPGGFAHLMPAGFINVGTPLLLYITLGFLDWGLQGFTHGLFLGGNTFQTHRDVKANVHQLDDIPMAQTKSSPQIADHRLSVCTKTACGHLYGPLSTRLSTASQTGQGIQLIFRDDRLRVRDLTDLVTLGVRVFPQQQRPALLAGIRYSHHDVVDLLKRFQFATVSMMAFLTTLFSSKWLGFGPRRSLRPIRRGWLRGILRVLIKPLLQAIHFSSQPGDLFLKLNNLLFQGMVLVSQQDDNHLNRERRLFPVFGWNRQTSGQIHSHILLRDQTSFYCFFSPKMRLFSTCQFNFLPN
jgi:hypothetical protein